MRVWCKEVSKAGSDRAKNRVQTAQKNRVVLCSVQMSSTATTATTAVANVLGGTGAGSNVATPAPARAGRVRYRLLFWVLVACTVVTVVITVAMMYRMTQRPPSAASAPSSKKPARAPSSSTTDADEAPRVGGGAGGGEEAFAEQQRGDYGAKVHRSSNESARAATTEIVYVYSKTCGWCDRFNPVWQDFSERYDGRLGVRKVASDEPEAAAFRVSGYPTVLAWQDGRAVAVFAGERTVENLLRFAAAREHAVGA